MPKPTKPMPNRIPVAFINRVANESAASQAGEVLLRVKLEHIRENPHQPRITFEPAQLDELATSIATHGMLEPLVGREEPDGTYTLIAGGRRLRAARQLGLADVPMVLRRATNEELLDLALVENIQRADLHPVEHARALRQLVDRLGSQEKAAMALGVKRSTLAMQLSILNLEEPVLDTCQQVPGLSWQRVRQLLKYPEKMRLGLAQKMVSAAASESNEDSGSPLQVRKAPRAAPPNIVRISGKTGNAKSGFTARIHFSRKNPTEAERIEAFRALFTEGMKQQGRQVLVFELPADAAPEEHIHTLRAELERLQKK